LHSSLLGHLLSQVPSVIEQFMRSVSNLPVLPLTHTLGQLLKENFGDRSVSAYYSDFKAILATKLSGGNPIPKMEHLTTLLGCLEDTPIELTETLQAMILLTILPPKWDTIAQLFF
jgi:hypothetical protein